MKKHNLFIYLIIVILFILSEHSKAQSILAGGFSWEFMGTDSILVKLKLSNDCNGSSPGTVSILLSENLSGTALGTYQITESNPTDITPVCNGSCTRCTDPNCTFTYGIEEYTYQTLIVIPNTTACELKLTYSACCRSTSLTTGGAGTNFYTYAVFNRCVSPFDNSPELLYPSATLIGQNWEMSFDAGLVEKDVDPITGGLLDSLHFEFTTPRTSTGQITYNSGFDYNMPLTFKDYPGYQKDLPSGFHLDLIKGNILFTPTKLEHAIFAQKITTYRNGQYLGEILRDYYVGVTNTPGNHSPEIISSSFYKEVFPNQTVTFTINSDDEDTGDTVSLSWNASIPGAIWTDNSNQSPDHPTATVSWTPQTQHVSNIPYYFTVKASDDACPINSVTTKVFQILVKDPTNSISKNNHPKIKLYPNPTSNTLLIGLPGFSKGELNIYSMEGRLKYSNHVPLNQFIKLPELNAGLYLIKVQTPDFEYFEKLLIK